MTEHTPGPWIAAALSPEDQLDEGPRFNFEVVAHDVVVADVGTEEDARLIAAAPELLAALNELYTYALLVTQRLHVESDEKGGGFYSGDYICSAIHPDLDAAVTRARDTITKATGDNDG